MVTYYKGLHYILLRFYFVTQSDDSHEHLFHIVRHYNYITLLLLLLPNMFFADFHCMKNKNALTENKPPPIRRIRISDFGLPDPKCDPDRHQNCITWSLSHALPLQKISSKSVHKFASNPTDKQTDKQTAPKT